MSMLIMATALSSGSVGSFTHSAEPSRPSSSPAKSAKRMPRWSWPFARSQQAREFENARGAGSVVVRAGMNLADLRRRERIDVAVTEMIVVRADDDVLIGLAGKIGEHVVHGGARLLDIDAERNLQLVGKRERRGRRRRIDLILHVGERFSRRCKPCVRGVVFRLHDHDAGVLGPVDAAEFRELILFAVSQFSVDQDHGFGAMIPRVDRLGDQLGVLRQSGISALRGEARRLVAQEHDNLVLDVEMRVIVVAEFGRGCAIAGKYHGAGDFAGSGKTEGNEILIQFQSLLRFAVLHFQAIAFLQFCAGNHGEWLEIGFGARRLQSQGAVALLDQVRGALDALGPGAAAFHDGRGKRFDVVQVPFGIGGIGIARQRERQETQARRPSRLRASVRDELRELRFERFIRMS